MTDTKLSTIELEMRAAEEAYRKKMERLKRKAAAEEQRINAKVLEALRADHEDLYDSLRADAVEQLERERADRSRTARRARSSDGPDTSESVDDEGFGPARDAADPTDEPLMRSA